MLMKNDKVSKLTVIQKTFSSHWLRPHSLQNTHTHWHVLLRLRNKLPTMRVKMENRGQATSINYSWNFLLNYPMLLSRKFIILYIPWNFFHQVSSPFQEVRQLLKLFLDSEIQEWQHLKSHGWNKSFPSSWISLAQFSTLVGLLCLHMTHWLRLTISIGQSSFVRRSKF